MGKSKKPAAKKGGAKKGGGSGGKKQNEMLAPGVMRYGKAVVGKGGTKSWKNKAKKAAPAVDEDKIAAQGKHYSTIDAAVPISSSKKNAKACKVRASKGDVVILLAGPYKGKRVVVLGQTESGLLLVTGPYKVNGVPVRRVNQAYSITTSTSVKVGDVDAKFNDAYFKSAGSKAKKGEDDYFGDGEQKKEVSAERKADQEALDSSLVKAINADSELKGYMKAKFSLSKGQYPHTMNF